MRSRTRPSRPPAIVSPAALLLAGALAPAPATGQMSGPPPIDAPLRAALELEVRSRLRSPEPATVAWGAWIAGSFGIEAAAPRLRALLAAIDGRDLESRLVRLHLLDALVRLGVEVPAEEVLPHCTDQGLEPGLVLLARVAGAAERELWELWRTHGRGRGFALAWIATGNMLAHQRAAGFAAHLWRETEFTLELRVFAADQEPTLGGVGAAVSAGATDGRMQVPAAFPPTPRYRLVEAAEPGDVLLAPGAQPIHWRRDVREDRELGIGRRNHGRQRARLQLGWLSQMAGCDLQARGLQLRTSHELRFVDAESFCVEARAVLTEHRARFDRVALLLRERGALTDAELEGLPSPLTVEVHDLRSDPSTPLPSVDGDGR
ncbi:MAG: hypothetical protein AB7O97_05895 [Planctomycetota bacterium]